MNDERVSAESPRDPRHLCRVCGHWHGHHDWDGCLHCECKAYKPPRPPLTKETAPEVGHLEVGRGVDDDGELAVINYVDVSFAEPTRCQLWASAAILVGTMTVELDGAPVAVVSQADPAPAQVTHLLECGAGTRRFSVNLGDAQFGLPITLSIRVV